MRTVITKGGIQTFVSGAEYTFLEKFEKNPQLYKEKLNERDAEVARLLTSRGILNRLKDDNGIYYIIEKDKIGDK